MLCRCTSQIRYNHTQVYELSPLRGKDMAALGLPTSGGSWCGAEIQIPTGVEILDFVISDK